MVDHFQRQMTEPPVTDEAARAAQQSTWAKAYAPYLRKLMRHVEANPRQPLPEAIVATITSLPAHTRSPPGGLHRLESLRRLF